jgi:hypothetical protein
MTILPKVLLASFLIWVKRFCSRRMPKHAKKFILVGFAFGWFCFWLVLLLIYSQENTGVKRVLSFDPGILMGHIRKKSG